MSLKQLSSFIHQLSVQYFYQANREVYEQAALRFQIAIIANYLLEEITEETVPGKISGD